MTTACRVPRFAISYAESRNSALAVSSQYVMPISRYLVEMLPRLLALLGAVVELAEGEVAVGGGERRMRRESAIPSASA